MYFSKQYRFCFIHINKTGGRSLTNFLEQAVPDLKLTGLGLMAVHKPYSWLLDRSLIPSSYRIITIVRNPWARYESLYRYRRMKYRNNGPNKGFQNQDANNMEFNEWFQYQLGSSDPLNRPQTEWLPNDDYIRDQVLCLQLEHLEADTTEMLKAFGIDWPTGVEFPHLNKSPAEDIEWYKENSLELINRERYIIKNFYSNLSKMIGGN